MLRRAARLRINCGLKCGFIRRSPLPELWWGEKTSIKKPAVVNATAGEGGERGIRTPGPVTVNGFQDRRIRPLCHLS